MSAAAKALDALEAAGKAASPRPWSVSHRHASCTVNDDEECGLGLEIEGPPEATMRGQFSRAADARLIALAVNLAAPLAAVARAAMHYHATRTNYDALEAAIDALEAAAAKGGAS